MTDKTKALLPVTPDEYLIRKNGYYYRPFAAGYTINEAEAGRFTLDEAIRHSHPNGPDGPRDGIDYMPAPARQSHSLPGDEAAQIKAVMSILWKREQYNGVGPDYDNYRPGAKFDMGGRVARYEKEASDILAALAALTPSPCPGDGMWAEDVMVAFANHLMDYRQNHLRPDEEHLKAGISRAISLTADPLFPAALTPSAPISDATKRMEQTLGATFQPTPSALSDLQRLGQEYDGEAVQELKDALAGMVENFSPPVTDHNPTLLAQIEAHETASRVLAHHAQSTPSALSGDAGEGE